MTESNPGYPSSSSSFDDNESRSLMIFASEAELVDAICREIPPLIPSEARRALARFGPGRCERSLVHTMRGMEAGTVYRPPGWFLRSLVDNLEPPMAALREEPLASMVERLRQRCNGGSGQGEEDWQERYEQGKARINGDD